MDAQLVRVLCGGGPLPAEVGLTLPDVVDPKVSHANAVDGQLQIEASLVLQGKI